MSAAEILDVCRQNHILVRRVGNDLEMTPVFPEVQPMPVDLVEAVRQHKSELLTWLRWQEQADEMMAEHVRRLAGGWPTGCTLEGPRWEKHEREVNRAYTDHDLDSLSSALEAREDYAMAQFEAYWMRCGAE